MSQPDEKRLRELNAQLINLYVQLNQPSSRDHGEQSIRTQIIKLEREKDLLPVAILYDAKVEQYATILCGAASGLQLQRHNLSKFSTTRSTDLSSDEIHQYNIWKAKFNTIQKKIDTYRDKLLDMGLRLYEIDAIILEGYREQNQRFLLKLLRLLQATVQDYITEYQDKFDTIPDDLSDSILTWEGSEKRHTLTYNQLRILDIKADCLKAGIPEEDIRDSIKSVARWESDETQDYFKKSILSSFKNRFRRQS